MKAVIIEDEQVAAEALQGLLQEVCPGMEILAVLQSIDESVEWFSTHEAPDLAFMDIHLADGSSFAIFDETDVKCPVVFTTAYDEYALKAFSVNSIDYLLKPIGRQELERAMAKFRGREAGTGGPAGREASPSASQSALIAKLAEELRQGPRQWKSCFLVPERDKLIPLPANEIACIWLDTKMVKAFTQAGKVYYLDQTLDELARQLDPEAFFRANRQWIVARGAVKDLTQWFGNKLSVNLKIDVPERIVVSKARVGEFKKWFAG